MKTRQTTRACFSTPPQSHRPRSWWLLTESDFLGGAPFRGQRVFARARAGFSRRRTVLVQGLSRMKECTLFMTSFSTRNNNCCLVGLVLCVERLLPVPGLSYRRSPAWRSPSSSVCCAVGERLGLGFNRPARREVSLHTPGCSPHLSSRYSHAGLTQNTLKLKGRLTPGARCRDQSAAVGACVVPACPA